MIALKSPAAPAAALVCPICDLTEPSAHHCGSLLPDSRKATDSPSNSAASPALVPVPCASTSSTVSGPKPAVWYARRSARPCPSLGQRRVHALAPPVGGRAEPADHRIDAV